MSQRATTGSGTAIGFLMVNFDVAARVVPSVLQRAIPLEQSVAMSRIMNRFNCCYTRKRPRYVGMKMLG